VKEDSLTIRSTKVNSETKNSIVTRELNLQTVPWSWFVTENECPLYNKPVNVNYFKYHNESMVQMLMSTTAEPESDGDCVLWYFVLFIY